MQMCEHVHPTTLQYHDMKTKKILLIYTGGTIGMGVNAANGALEPLDFQHFVHNVPELDYLQTDIDCYQFEPPIDSSDMTPAKWSELVDIISARYHHYDGFVILHGTDTMSYTASALSFMLENVGKPVVLTGSQLPIGQLRTDGRENLVTSLEIAAASDDDGCPTVPEVCIYFNGKLLRGNRSTKTNADGFNAFDSPNYPCLADAGINIVYRRKNILMHEADAVFTPHTAMDQHLLVLSLFPGIEESMVERMLDIEGLRSVVMRSFGSGNAPQQPWLNSLLARAVAKGIVVVNVSQCMAGNVVMGRYETGYQLQQAGVVSGYDATVEATVAKLMYLQARYADPADVIDGMNRSLCGEITVG